MGMRKLRLRKGRRWWEERRMVWKRMCRWGGEFWGKENEEDDGKGERRRLEEEMVQVREWKMGLWEGWRRTCRWEGGSCGKVKDEGMMGRLFIIIISNNITRFLVLSGFSPSIIVTRRNKNTTIRTDPSQFILRWKSNQITNLPSA